MDILKMSQLQLDALREISSIAAGNAATGLSQMLGKRIGIEMPTARIVPLGGVSELFGGEERTVSAVYIVLTGGISGSILLVWPCDRALELAETLAGIKCGAPMALDEFGQSTLKELANIVVGSYLGAMSKMMGLKMIYSVPAFATDMLGALLDGLLIQLSMEAEYAVVIETEFIIESVAKKESGFLLFMPDTSGLKTILKKIGMEKK